MASPHSERFAITPSSDIALSIRPGSRVMQSPLTDDVIWRRLKEAGFDEESIKRRDKAALIGYIAKLETEIFDHQHHMGLLILERKELASKYEQIKASAESAELMHKRDRAAHLSALAEARKREESLKKALGVEKECIASIEKALHEMRAESAEAKVAAESKLGEAHIMADDAQKKFAEAEAKLHAAESLQAEASRFHRAAQRKIQEVEAREVDLNRRIVSFKTDCDVKEKEIILERQSLSERQKILQQEHERLLDGQALLNQREDYIFSRSQELHRLEKELEASRASFENDYKALKDEKANLELTVVSLSKREEAVIEREALLNKKEQLLLVSQEKLASKESDEIQKVIANQKNVLRTRKSEFEAELEMKRKLVEDEIETKRRAWELREVELSQREDLLREREHDLEVQSRSLADKEKDVVERSNLLDEKERNLNVSEKEVELKKSLLQKEKEEINRLKLDLQKSLSSLEDKKKQVDWAKEKLEAMKSETNELSVLEMKIKEELDIVRAQKLELMAEADKLRVEKAKFESEWELIDEKREELRKEAERVAEERRAVSKFLKDERDSLRLERDAMRDQHRNDVESLNHEREDFMSKMVHERSEWFNKIQQERAEFLLGIEMQKRELETCIEKRREELESYLREREEAFEQEKKSELQYISSLKETAEKELEQVSLEMKRLDTERMEINLDRERRDREWAELNNSIEELKVQRQKLEKQRELLHADRQEIHAEIENLKKLEDLKVAADNAAVAEMVHSNMEFSRRKISAKRYLKQQSVMQDGEFDSHKQIDVINNGNGFKSLSMQKPDGASPPSSARFSWIKRCTELIFKHSPEKPPVTYEEQTLKSDHDDGSLTLAGKLDSFNGYDGQKYMGNNKSKKIFSERQPMTHVIGEPKVIPEVPPEGEVLKGMHDLESEIKEDDTEKSAHSISEEGFQAGRKRRFNKSSSNDCIDPLPVQMQNIKKRRQREVAPVNPSEEGITQCVISTHSKVIEDQHAFTSSNQIQGGADETSVLIVEKIIKISEVTCENPDADNSGNQEKIDHFQNPVAESDQDTLQGGGTYELANSTHVGNGLSPCGSEEQGMIQEVGLENVGQVAEQSQFQENISESSEQTHRDHVVAESDISEKINDKPGKRARSKRKL